MASELSYKVPGVSGDKENSEPIIELRGVSKRFGALAVLENIDLSIEKGRTTVVIGESGTGKSVLLKHIVALMRPDSGAVYFHGRRIDHLSEAQLVPTRRQFGLLFQMGALFDSMTVAENIAFPITQHTHVDEAQLRDTVSQKLRMVGLDGLQHRRPGEISGGQKKRVALARAIALNPEVVLYDEPTTGLDPVRSDVINEMILKLKKELNVTGIVVTHDMTSAYKVADRIVMLQHGKVIADGDAAYFKSTNDHRVRRFVDGKADPNDLAALDDLGDAI
jgi:phospholipid/cholesterol/gamma-HCH transport system ATP-binding protein